MCWLTRRKCQSCKRAVKRLESIQRELVKIGPNLKVCEMKKTGFIFGVLILLLVGLFVWSLSGASDKHAPTDVKTIDVSPEL